MIRRGTTRVGQALVVACLLALLAGQVLGQPVLLGFVETGSMEPTIETGDGFVAIPAALASDPEPGDVVVFEAEEIQGGGLTTHRVVEETDRGYVTRGDANPFTDQDGGEPYVRDEQIVATAWRVNGEVVTVPKLGTAVTAIGDGFEDGQRWLAFALGTRALLGTSGLASLTLALSVGFYAIETVRERRQPSFESRFGRDDDAAIDPRHVAAGFALLIVVSAAAAMLVPAGTHSYGVISAEFESDRPLVIERGTTDDVSYPVANGGFVPVVSYVDSGADDVAVEPRPAIVGPRDDGEVTVSITAPDETGYYPTYVTEYRYLYVLPLPVLDALYELHPWAPFLTIVSLLGGGTYGLSRLVLGPGDPRSRREATRTNRTGLRAKLRRLR